MAICGYHGFMGEGLRRFGEGLSIAIANKARQNNRELREQLFHEQDEIELLTHFLESVLQRTADQRERKAARGFLGLVYVCRFLMAELGNVDAMQKDMPEFIGKNCERLITILEEFEARFEEVQTGSSSVARTLSAWAKVRHID